MRKSFIYNKSLVKSGELVNLNAYSVIVLIKKISYIILESIREVPFIFTIFTIFTGGAGAQAAVSGPTPMLPDKWGHRLKALVIKTDAQNADPPHMWTLSGGPYLSGFLSTGPASESLNRCK
jgi:hypothetical protein